jgi:alkanesulfonate monooxygenase
VSITDSLEVFSTCPQSRNSDPGDYARRVAEVARWSEEAGYRGILVYADNGIVDPWLTSQLILESTDALCPLIALQPIYMHPYAAAKMVTTLAYMHGRKICLNMLAGGFKNDLAALADPTPHDDRYVRTSEYALIMKHLLSTQEPLTFDGRYYRVENLKLSPALDPSLAPDWFISGSSAAGLEAARAIGAIPIKYPKPPGEEDDQSLEPVAPGIRVGIVARDDDGDAWNVARDRFPDDRMGQITHALAMKVSDSQWHRELSDFDERPASAESPYWLGPFQSAKTFCPYLVGSYARVGEELARYLTAGYRTFVLDIPPSADEIQHTARAFEAAIASHAER